MKHNARKLLALVMALLLSVFALAEDGMQEIGTDEIVEIGGGTGNGGESVGGAVTGDGEIVGGEGDPADELALALDADPAGEVSLALDGDAPEGIVDPEGEGLALALDAELAPETDMADNGLAEDASETSEQAALPPETELAMNAEPEWQDWPASGAPTSAGSYKVDKEVTLSSDWGVSAGETKLWLTGAGKIILGSSVWITVADGAKLEIVSESTGTIEGGPMKAAIVVGANGTFKMHGGKINGKGTPMAGEGVVYNPSGDFTMTGGTIEAIGESGCAVYNGNDFTMTGGTIKATGTSGRAVHNSGTFTMTGGEIQVAENGVAVQNTKKFDMSGGTINAIQNNGKGVVNKDNNASFDMSGNAKINANYIGVENGDTEGGSIDGGTITMSGGQIIGQRAEVSKGVSSFSGRFTMTGGEISNFDTGVSINGTNFTMDKTGSDSSGTIRGNGRGVNVDGTFYMNAGKIQNNTLDGVYYSSGTFNMSGGSITGNGRYGLIRYATTKITLSGQVDISGNTEADIYFPLNQSSSGDLKIENGFGCDKPISVSGNPTGLQNHVFTSGFSKTGSSDPAKYFKSGAEGYGLFWNKDKNEVMFDKSVTITFDANGGEGTMEPWTAPWGNKRGALVPECEFTRRGHTFNAWLLKTTDGSEIIPAGIDTFFNDGDGTVLYAVWNQNEVEVTYPEDQVYTGKAIEPKLTVTDKVTNEKLVEGTDYTVAYSNNVNVTNYAVVTLTFKGDYKDCEQEHGYFAITPKPLTVTANNLTKAQGEDDPELTWKADGLVDGDKLTGSLVREKGEKPGTYKITQGTLDNKNYKITFVEGTLTIKAKSDDKPTGAGDIDTDVETGKGVPEMKVGGLTDEAAKDLATKAELERIEQGEDLLVYLKAKNIDDSVSAADKKLVTAAITAKDKNGKVAQYLDFSMYKRIGKDPAKKLTDLKGHNVTITITVPKAFEAPAGVKRTFYIVRVHDGKAEIVGSGTGSTIYVNTDKFSTYALTYVDEKAEPTVKPTAKPDYTLLAQMTVAGSSKTALRVKWQKVKGAEGYDVYFARCGKDYGSKAKASVSGCSVRFTKLKKRVEYKAYVKAWKKVKGKKTYIGEASPEVHAITGGYDAKNCNTKSVKLNKGSLSLSVGKSKTLKATVKGVKSGKKVLEHVRKVRYYSSNANVATVNRNGKVKAVGKGSCTIWAIANNGVRTSVKVTVK